MTKEAVQLFMVAIIFTVIFCFSLVLCYMIYLAYCQRCCVQHRSENNSERTRAMYHVTEEAPEPLEGYQEDQPCNIVFLINDSIIN